MPTFIHLAHPAPDKPGFAIAIEQIAMVTAASSASTTKVTLASGVEVVVAGQADDVLDMIDATERRATVAAGLR